MAGAVRAFQRVSRDDTASMAKPTGPILIAEVPPAAMPKSDASPAAWLVAIAGSLGAYAVVEMKEEEKVS
jgi:hypothetical protein